MKKKTIGEFISALRKANGLTQQDVADRLNVSNKAVSRWERGECAPDLMLIPAIAEMFGVTCDELLKGERIFNTTQAVKSEPKVEKQLKAIVSNAVSSFKLFIWISLALSVLGLIFMYGISYGFYRPVIGFFVMMLFAVLSFALTVITVSRMKETKNNNELFENADESILSRYNSTLANYSFTSFFTVISVVVLSLPLVLFRDNYIESVLVLGAYLKIAFFIAIVLALIYLYLKKYYFKWITGEDTLDIKRDFANLKMTALQLGAVIASCLCVLIAPYFTENLNSATVPEIVTSALELIFFALNFVFFFVFMLKYKEKRSELQLSGIRNMILSMTPFFLSGAHSVFFSSEDEIINENTVWERFDYWYYEDIFYTAVFVLSVFLIFKTIEYIKSKKR